MTLTAQERRPFPKPVKKVLVTAAILLAVILLGFIIPPAVLAGVGIAYVVFGAIDVSRNQQNGEAPVLKRYFTGNGVLTWVLSPLNLFMDLLSKRTATVLRKDDLPAECQQEIDEMIAAVDRDRIKIEERLESRAQSGKRLMLLYKWYGRQLDTSIPELNKDFKYIKTIGVSVFSANASTSYHYGPLRITYRLLYNMNPVDRDDVFIQVGRVKHLWRDDPMFIFDDTLMHRSVNKSPYSRYCLFVDIMRPARFSLAFNTYFLNGVGAIMRHVNRIFYKNWEFIK
jgi:beta-hydroxylase